MTDKLFIVDEAGARVGDLVTAKERFDNANKKVFGEDLDIKAHTPQNEIAGINALVWTEVGEELLRAAIYGASVDHAPGVFLDALGSLYDIRRGKETYTTVVATITGDEGTIIPAGRFAKTISGDQFKTKSQVTITNGTAKVTMESVNPGPIIVKEGELNSIVSVQNGWKTITNEQPGIVGSYKESDASYRSNIKLRTAHSSVGPIPALESALHQAGATLTRIIENPTNEDKETGGITIPPHSICVIVDGGREDDITAAIENHRGMGVGNYCGINGGQVDLQKVQSITHGRIIFNRKTITNINLQGKSIEEIASELTTSIDGLTVQSNPGNLIAFHLWSDHSTGFESFHGIPATSYRTIQYLTPISSDYENQRIRVEFNNWVTNDGSSEIIKYTNDQGNEITHTNTGNTRKYFGNMVIISLGTAIPSTATNVTISLPNIKDINGINFPVENYNVNNTPLPSNSPPSDVKIWGRPIPSGVEIWGSARGTGIIRWKYKRFQDGGYLDTNFVNISNSNHNDIHSEIPGYTNGIEGSKIEVTAENSYGTKLGNFIVFTPYSKIPVVSKYGSPQKNSIYLNGKTIEIKYDTPLMPNLTTGQLTQWNITSGGTTNPVIKQRVIDHSVYLTLTNPYSGNYTSPTISYTKPSTGVNAIQGINGQSANSFTNRTLTDNSSPGIPSPPIPIIAYITSTGYEFTWEPNYDGGSQVDKIEYQVTFNGGATWSEWSTIPITPNKISIATTKIPTHIKIITSNINSRAADILGLTTNKEIYPFVRPTQQPLKIAIELEEQDEVLTLSEFESIKNSIVNYIKSYSIGETLYRNDINAIVESIKNVKVNTLSVKSNNINVDSIKQNIYNQWTISKDDISITFP